MEQIKDRSIAMKLSMLAKSKGMTQKRLAEQCGLSRITIHRFFNGHTELKCNDFMKLLKLLGMDVESQIDETLETALTGQKKTSVSDDINQIIDNAPMSSRKTFLQQVVWLASHLNVEGIEPAKKRLETELDRLTQTVPNKLVASNSLNHWHK